MKDQKKKPKDNYYIKKKKSASPLMDLSANLLRDDEDNDNTRTNRGKGEMTTGRLKLFMDAVYGIFATMAGVQLAFLDQGEVCEVYINQLEQSEKMQIHQYEFPNGISCPKLKNRSSIGFVEPGEEFYDIEWHVLSSNKFYALFNYYGAFAFIVLMLYPIHNKIFNNVDIARIYPTVQLHTHLVLGSALIPVFSQFGQGGLAYVLGSISYCLLMIFFMSIALHGWKQEPTAHILVMFLALFIDTIILGFVFDAGVYGYLLGYGIWMVFYFILRAAFMNLNIIKNCYSVKNVMNNFFYHKIMIEKERLCTFTDGVVAISATFIALEYRIHSETNVLEWIRHNVDKILCSALAVSILFTLWSTHHQIIEEFGEKISSQVVLVNYCFCFCITLIPISTSFAYYFGNGAPLFTKKGAVALPFIITFLASMLLIYMRRTAKDTGLKPQSGYALAQRLVVPINCLFGIILSFVLPLPYSNFALAMWVVFGTIPMSQWCLFAFFGKKQ